MEPETWVFRVEAHPGESLGHYLGRFRRANNLSHKAVGDHLGIRAEWVRDWERPSQRRPPTPLQLIALSKLVEVEVTQLSQMLPPDHLHLQTRLCPACYAQTPVHQRTWQQAGKTRCSRHRIQLLSSCPVCGSGFRTPALWDNEHCEGCGLSLSEMQEHR